MFVTGDSLRERNETDAKQPRTTATTEYCAKLQQWMWRYYWGSANWQSWVALSAFPFPPQCSFPAPGTSAQTPGAPASTSGGGEQVFDARTWHSYPFHFPAASSHPGGAHTEHNSTATPTSTSAADVRPAPQQNGNPAQAGREYTIPSLLQRLLAETVDFFILFCVKATVVLWIMHLSGMKDIAKFITHFIVEEIDENTSMEDLQKMMVVALVYRVLVCVYEIICIWGTGGATPGKFLLGLRVVTCDTTTLVRPNQVLVVPASNVSLSASTVRALNKNFSIAFLFPVFITLLFFQHNRTVYDVVAGTIVVRQRGGR
ncbi:protein FAM8A1 [Mastacembelus armatus]|uniref:Family with sequence similarity 8 member A1a n=1 Tax=Mastacembelus armatus TaxID=205130 RepID=A0A7N9AKK4_9TELE|nr:protein FAM8A1-like [Mastacembelus armatus]